MALILFIKILVILYSPLFLPERIYRLQLKATEYIYNVPVPEEAVTVRVAVTQDPLSYGDENADKRVRLSDLEHMEYFKAMVSGNRWQQDKVYEAEFEDQLRTQNEIRPYLTVTMA